MESKSFSYRNGISKFPIIKDRYNTELTSSDQLSDTWKLNQVRIKDRLKDFKLPGRNFFLPNNESSISPISQRAPIIKLKQHSPIDYKKRLNYLEMQLDDQEMKHKTSDTPKSLEKLFFSYYNYFEGIIQCTPSQYYTFLKRAKNGFMSIFKKLFPKVMHLDIEYEEKSSQTIMSINPSKHSVILSKLGDIINHELAGVEKLEKFIQKNFILNKWKAKISNACVQTDYRSNIDGVFKYEFKSYEEMEKELESMRIINSVLVQEKALTQRNYKELGDTEKIMQRNKALESVIIKMRNFGQYRAEDLQLDEDENIVFNSTEG